MKWGIETFCWADWTKPRTARLTAVLSALIISANRRTEESLRIKDALALHEEQTKNSRERLSNDQKIEHVLQGCLKILEALENLGESADKEAYRSFLLKEKERYQKELRDVKARLSLAENDIFKGIRSLSILENRVWLFPGYSSCYPENYSYPNKLETRSNRLEKLKIL